MIATPILLYGLLKKFGMDEKYWKEYTKFIKLPEQITGGSPATLLEHYKTLVEELENDNYRLEWQYEESENQKTFQKITNFFMPTNKKAICLSSLLKLKLPCSMNE